MEMTRPLGYIVKSECHCVDYMAYLEEKEKRPQKLQATLKGALKRLYRSQPDYISLCTAREHTSQATEARQRIESPEDYERRERLQNLETTPPTSPAKWLPPEIWTMIWHFMAQEPRIVIVEMGIEDCISSDRRHIFLSTRTTPTVLHICRESRAVGLKYYTLNLGAHDFTVVTPQSVLNDHIWINPSLDTIFFSHSTPIRPRENYLNCSAPLMDFARLIGLKAREIGHLMLYDYDSIDYFNFFKHFRTLNALQCHFKGLKSISFSNRHSDEFSRSGFDVVQEMGFEGRLDGDYRVFDAMFESLGEGFSFRKLWWRFPGYRMDIRWKEPILRGVTLA